MVTWITSADVAEALGIPVTDTGFLDRCTEAANAYAFRRRAEAGYVDSPDVSPGPDASMGVTIYAVALYRERGAVDSFASFDAFQSGIVPAGTFAQVNRLLGVPRAAVDRPDPELVVNPLYRARHLRGVHW